MKKSLVTNQFLGFVFAGGIAACANFVSRIFYNHWIPYKYAIILAYITGMIIAFILMRKYVFSNYKKNTHFSFIYFIIVNFAAVLQTWVISMALATNILPGIGLHSNTNEIAHAIGIAVPVFTSYVGHKYISFK